MRDWFSDLYEEFGDSTPPPDKINRIINQVNKYYGANPVKYLGSGDNGIVYQTDDGDVIKYTIDNKEAATWARIKGKSLAGITQLRDIVQLSGPNGDTIVYVIKAAIVPHPLNPEQSQAVRKILNKVQEQGKGEAIRARISKLPQQQRHSVRTGRFVREFQNLADADPSFKNIPDLLMDLADKFGAYLFDLQPDNFRVGDDGLVSLVDPSVPDLVGDSNPPGKLVYEDRLVTALWCKPLIF